MHLLDMPKPNSRRSPLGTLLLVITGFCLGLSLMCVYNASYMCRYGARVPDPEPVKWGTVKTSKIVIDRGRADQKLLMELYEELCEMVSAAETDIAQAQTHFKSVQTLTS